MDKPREARITRLTQILANKLENPPAALEMLMSELKLGAPHPELWQAFHDAATRDELEVETVWAYQKVTAERRLAGLPSDVAADLLVRAANFTRRVLGDDASADDFLQRALVRMPQHAEAFAILVERYREEADPRKLLELYGLVASNPPAGIELAQEAMVWINKLTSKTPLADETCKRLVVLIPMAPSMLVTLESHLRKADRLALLAECLESGVAMPGVSEKAGVRMRRLLMQLYLDSLKTPASAMVHVEALLAIDAGDVPARNAAKRLLSHSPVATRAAAALARARHHDSKAPGH